MPPIKLILILVFLTISQSILLAQAPGYLGKRTTIEVSGEWQLAVFNPNRKGKSSFEGLVNDGFYSLKGIFKENKIHFNSTLNLQVNYAINRVNSVGIKYHRATTGTTIYTKYSPSIFSDILISTFSEIGIQRMGLTYSFFKLAKGSIAPIGTSYSVALGGVFMDSKKMTTLDSYDREIQPLTELYPSLNTKLRVFDIGIGWNKRWLVVDNVFIKTGLHFNLMMRPKGMHFYFNEISYSEYDVDPVQADYNTAVLNRTLMHNLFNFEVGIGALLF